MKRFLILVLAIALSLCSISFAEEDDEGIDPDYLRMEENRILIGKDVCGDPMYEFDGMNTITKNGNSFRLINLDNFLDLTYKYNIKYASSYGTTINDRKYYVICLYDDSKYAFECFTTYDYDYFITVEDFEIFCRYFFDPTFVFDE